MRPVLALLVAVLGASLTASAQAQQTRSVDGRAYDLPDVVVQPEGIAATGTTFYTGSRENGTIVAGDLRTGEVRTLSPGGRGGRDNALGLEVDGSTLWVAGGPTGKVFALDRRTGRTRAVFTLTGEGTNFVNDLTIRGPYLYATDSRRPGLYRITRRDVPRTGTVRRRDVAPFLPFEGTPLEYVEDENNLNGIEAVGDVLVSVQSVNGRLWRIDPRTRAVSAIPVSGGPLTNGDGLVAAGGALYAVQNATGTIAKVQLRAGQTRGRVVARRRSSVLPFPTTIAVASGRFVLPNARFDEEPGSVPYTVGSIPRF